MNAVICVVSLLLVQLSFAADLVTTRCEPGWSALNSAKCIKLLVNPAPPHSPVLMKYQDAKAVCNSQHEGSNLLVLNTRDELTAAERVLVRPNNILNIGGSVWVDEGQPRRLEGLDDMDNTMRSDPIEHSNRTARDLNVRSCVRIMLGTRKELASSWRSEACSSRLPVVCQRAPLPSLNIHTLEQLNSAYLNSKAEILQTKAELTEVKAALIAMKQGLEETQASMSELNERLKEAEVQVMNNTLEISKVQFLNVFAAPGGVLSSPHPTMSEVSLQVEIDEPNNVENAEATVAMGTEEDAVNMAASENAQLVESEAVQVNITTSENSELVEPEAVQVNITTSENNGVSTETEAGQTNSLARATTEDISPAPSLRCLSNPLPPVGYVYTQYPNQLPPTALWPKATWQEITSEYAGLFFRAEGGDSLPFGLVQNDNAPRVTEVSSVKRENVSDSITLTPGEVSKGVTTGIYYLGFWPHWSGLKFNMSDGEVRPKNMAIRLFKRC